MRSTHKIQLYFYALATNNLKMKFKKIPFAIVSERMKHSVINTSTKLILWKLSNIIQGIKDLNKWRNTEFNGSEDLVLLRQ